MQPRRLLFLAVVAWPAAALLALACSSSDDTGATPPTGAEASAPDGAAASPAADAGAHDADASSACAPSGNDTPRDLACTGLYADLVTKQIASGIREYTPAAALWSDGADKTRWLSLPPGTTIDDSDPNEWKFPVGTKLWKEFKLADRRVETRLFHKIGNDQWIHAAYGWAADELSATRVDGADFTLDDGRAYHIPTPSECDKCHNGRRDRVLGFDAISLGLSEAAGVTLATLAKDALLTPPPTRTSFAIGDGSSDALVKEARALAWLNVNCGITCHNGNTTATAYPTGLRFRLDASQLDGGTPTADWDVLRTSLGVPAFTPAWSGQVRIVPGRPDRSLVVRLISERGTEQMPPIDSHVVDGDGVKLVREWIASLPLLPDAGPDDAGSEADGGDGG